MSLNQHTVEYRPIQGFPGYRVGDDGSVWSCRRRGGSLREEWRRMSERPSKRDGRIYVGLFREEGRALFLSYTLVLEAFVGPCPDGMQACHFPDRDTTNNRLSNLRWDTPKRNQADRILHGTDNRGERSSSAKLTESQVIEIRKLRGLMSQSKIGAMFGVRQQAVHKILTGKRWSHLPAA